MWPDMVEFCSASSEIRGRKWKEARKKNPSKTKVRRHVCGAA